MTSAINRQWVLNQRPVGEPDKNTLRLVETAVPTPGPGEMLLRNIYLSLDPYMRGRMSDEKSYAEPVAIGGVMVGGTVSRVIDSNLDGFATGDLVVSTGGWQDYALSNGALSFPVNGVEHPSWTLGVLGMPGFTAWAGLTQIGKPKPGETLVVAAATGPVGGTVGQIGKILGLRVVGVAGGAAKCRSAVEDLGFDACIDHSADDFAEQLAAACPDGIDIYFENVGGKVFEAVVGLLNPLARIPLCGNIAEYNATELPDGKNLLGWAWRRMQVMRVTVRGFIIYDDFGHLYPEFAKEMGQWVADGKIKYREQIVEGLENAPEALNDVLTGKNFGKMIVHIAD